MKVLVAEFNRQAKREREWSLEKLKGALYIPIAVNRMEGTSSGSRNCIP